MAADASTGFAAVVGAYDDTDLIEIHVGATRYLGRMRWHGSAVTITHDDRSTSWVDVASITAIRVLPKGGPQPWHAA